MPIRNPRNTAQEVDVTKTAKKSTKPETPFKELSDKDKKLRLAQSGLSYLSKKRDADALAKKIKAENAEIKSNFMDSGLYEINGKHKELYLPAGDGMNEVFIQIQGKESVSMVDNIVDLVRKKAGKKADNFIMTVEVLHENALEAMLNQGLITEKDLEEWLVKNTSESLIVKLNKKKS